MEIQTEIFAKAKSGCDHSRGELLERYRKHLKILAEVQLGPSIRGKADASDVVQETFLSAHRSFNTFRGSSDAELSGWLQSILASRLADLIRLHTSQKRNVNLEEDICDRLDQSSVALGQVLQQAGPTPSGVAVERENARLISAAIAELPQDYRTVILLRHIRSFSYAEIATEMERSVDSVKKLWVRALAKLQKTMEGDQ